MDCMKKIYLFLCSLLAICSIACSDDEGEAIQMPKVWLLDGRIEANRLNIKIVPTNAEKCAYTYFLKSESAPTAEEVMALGTPVSLEGEKDILISGLEWDKKYTLMAVAQNKSGQTASASVDFVVGKDFSNLWTEGANCYIASEVSDYSFMPMKVSGEAIAGIAKVDWLWSTKVDGESTQTLVKNLVYKEGKVHFTTTGKRGSVVIGAFDSTDKLLWSWHIWCTEEPASMVYEDGTQFMDRFLGATAARAKDGNKTWGMHYQWGRKDPFFSGTEDEVELNVPFRTTGEQTLVNPSYGMEWRFVPERCDMETSIASPMTMYAYDMHWLDDGESVITLWGESKSDYDPCPEGYRVPLVSEVQALKKLKYDGSSGYDYVNGTSKAWWPGWGLRDDMGIYVLGEVCFMWTASIIENTRMAYRVAANRNVFVDTQGMGDKSMGQGIRCVVEQKNIEQ